MLKFIIKMYELDEIAENSEVEMRTALDGAKFTKCIACATCEMKVVNARSRSKD